MWLRVLRFHWRRPHLTFFLHGVATSPPRPTAPPLHASPNRIVIFIQARVRTRLEMLHFAARLRRARRAVAHTSPEPPLSPYPNTPVTLPTPPLTRTPLTLALTLILIPGHQNRKRHPNSTDPRSDRCY